MLWEGHMQGKMGGEEEWVVASSFESGFIKQVCGRHLWGSISVWTDETAPFVCFFMYLFIQRFLSCNFPFSWGRCSHSWKTPIKTAKTRRGGTNYKNSGNKRRQRKQSYPRNHKAKAKWNRRVSSQCWCSTKKGEDLTCWRMAFHSLVTATRRSFHDSP